MKIFLLQHIGLYINIIFTLFKKMFSTEHLNNMQVVKCHNTAHHKYVKTITKRPVQQQAFVLYSVSAQLTDAETRVSRHSVHLTCVSK